ncbi:HBL152Cp [Eremothecium sinecaudum]|uniref:Exocyst complex component EXO84 n=1 Tax=Eremothecium sinecaudum TaxID=45286 RepID=A0A120K0W4_9SACH|nr:HBL152Cp [Eremothecium sinecaudum]AMD18750.1 HBL152Cp [Eremothecium sinecaudum]
MVDFSLKRARNNWNKLSSPVKAKNEPAVQLKAKAYEEFVSPQESSQLPEIGVKDRKKVGTSMQRRLSFHSTKHSVPIIDFSAMPNLPTVDYLNREPSPSQHQHMKRTQKRTPSDIYEGRSLRDILSNPKFQAKRFVHEKLGEATALEIDNFASDLHDLSLEIEEKLKLNVSTSYNEILALNKNLDVVVVQLKELRNQTQQLQSVMEQFSTMAEKRLQLEKEASRNSSGSSVISRGATPSLIPPLHPARPGRDKTSIYMLEKIWSKELSTLLKTVEGSQKYISPAPGRHILMQSSDWLEVNIATLKPLHNVHIYLLNDMLLVAISRQDIKGELVAKQCCTLRELDVSEEPNYTLSFHFGNKHHSLYRARKPTEYAKLLENIKSAKDELRGIYQAEEDNVRRLRDSFTFLQSTQQTPNRDMNSPIRVHSRQKSLTGPTNPGRNQTYQDNLLQNISVSVHTRSRSGEVNKAAVQMKLADNELEELSVPVTRMDFPESIARLTSIENILSGVETGNEEEVMLLDLLKLKCSQNRALITQKLTHIINTEYSDTEKLISSTKALISLGVPVDALKLYLHNRSNFIQELVLQVGVHDNSNSYITQAAIIRFQTIKKVAAKFQQLYDGNHSEYSSILVNWCDGEVDKHFQLMRKQLISEDQVTPQAIKITRKQIDELKSVGMDFVYKLDDFLRVNSSKVL